MKGLLLILMVVCSITATPVDDIDFPAPKLVEHSRAVKDETGFTFECDVGYSKMGSDRVDFTWDDELRKYVLQPYFYFCFPVKADCDDLTGTECIDMDVLLEDDTPEPTLTEKEEAKLNNLDEIIERREAKITDRNSSKSKLYCRDFECFSKCKVLAKTVKKKGRSNYIRRCYNCLYAKMRKQQCNGILWG